jgi:four helix bundle protein
MERGRAKTFQDLIVWQKAHQFVILAYHATEVFPNKEIYGLTSQFRRAAVSIPANIAEGFKKTGKLDKFRFMNIAQGSLYQVAFKSRSRRRRGIDEGVRFSTSRSMTRRQQRYANEGGLVLEEFRYYLILARDLGYSETNDLMSQVEEVSSPH